MQNIYQVENSYHLMEGLDSEFLVIASSVEQAKDVCLRLLAEDQDSHIETIKENLKNLIKSQEKQWALMEQDEEKAMFFKKAADRGKENIDRYTELLRTFNGYKRECLTVHKIDSRLKNGHIQYLE